MDHNTKKQQHEKARKKHKQELKEYAREAAKRGSSKMPLMFLLAGIAIIAVLVLAASFR